MENNEWDMSRPERSKEFLQVCTWIHRVGAVGCEVFGVDHDWKHFMDVFLEVLDADWQRADEGLVDEAKVSEEVMADDYLSLLSETFDDLLERLSNGWQLLFGLLAILVVEPLGVDAR